MGGGGDWTVVEPKDCQGGGRGVSDALKSSKEGGGGRGEAPNMTESLWVQSNFDERGSLQREKT
jgi:hypothetical protein